MQGFGPGGIGGGIDWIGGWRGGWIGGGIGGGIGCGGGTGWGGGFVIGIWGLVFWYSIYLLNTYVKILLF